ncbi:hypothetical protein M404DRAFT_32654 [Pisolithus tinctorius Marx 270]|uniref:Uncharacterized protein n=1 Tax=Pisolithus tinctorius Marx 270 TaxID=870435 RepID=A0A0C3IJ92_PISTI|nr:hypothetical protein M404DRAFT_32654 [Pisolithus tinctorius Marx 270]
MSHEPSPAPLNPREEMLASESKEACGGIGESGLSAYVSAVNNEEEYRLRRTQILTPTSSNRPAISIWMTLCCDPRARRTAKRLTPDHLEGLTFPHISLSPRSPGFGSSSSSLLKLMPSSPPQGNLSLFFEPLSLLHQQPQRAWLMRRYKGCIAVWRRSACS